MLACACAAGGVSLGKNITAATAATTTASAAASAVGFDMSVRMSRAARRGSVVMGLLVARREMMKMAITLTYVMAHRIQKTFRTKYDAHARYSAKATPTDENARI